jgi:hypothetical protein
MQFCKYFTEKLREKPFLPSIVRFLNEEVLSLEYDFDAAFLVPLLKFWDNEPNNLQNSSLFLDVSHTRVESLLSKRFDFEYQVPRMWNLWRMLNYFKSKRFFEKGHSSSATRKMILDMIPDDTWLFPTKDYDEETHEFGLAVFARFKNQLPWVPSSGKCFEMNDENLGKLFQLIKTQFMVRPGKHLKWEKMTMFMNPDHARVPDMQNSDIVEVYDRIVCTEYVKSFKCDSWWDNILKGFDDLLNPDKMSNFNVGLLVKTQGRFAKVKSILEKEKYSPKLDEVVRFANRMKGITHEEFWNDEYKGPRISSNNERTAVLQQVAKKPNQLRTVYRLDENTEFIPIVSASFIKPLILAAYLVFEDKQREDLAKNLEDNVGKNSINNMTYSPPQLEERENPNMKKFSDMEKFAKALNDKSIKVALDFLNSKDRKDYSSISVRVAAEPLVGGGVSSGGAASGNVSGANYNTSSPFRIGSSISSADDSGSTRILPNGQMVSGDDALILESNELRGQLSKWLQFPEELSRKLGAMAPVTSAQNMKIREQITDLYDAESMLSSRLRDIAVFAANQKIILKQQQKRHADHVKIVSTLTTDDEKIEYERNKMELEDAIKSIENVIEETELGQQRYTDMLEEVKTARASLISEASTNPSGSYSLGGGPVKISARMSKIIDALQRVGGTMDNNTLALDGVPFDVKVKETNFEPLDASEAIKLKNLEQEIKERNEKEKQVIGYLELLRNVNNPKFIQEESDRALYEAMPEFINQLEELKQKSAEMKTTILDIVKKCKEKTPSATLSYCDAIQNNVDEIFKDFKDPTKSFDELKILIKELDSKSTDFSLDPKTVDSKFYESNSSEAIKYFWEIYSQKLIESSILMSNMQILIYQVQFFKQTVNKMKILRELLTSLKNKNAKYQNSKKQASKFSVSLSSSNSEETLFSLFSDLVDKMQEIENKKNEEIENIEFDSTLTKDKIKVSMTEIKMKKIKEMMEDAEITDKGASNWQYLKNQAPSTSTVVSSAIGTTLFGTGAYFAGPAAVAAVGMAPAVIGGAVAAAALGYGVHQLSRLASFVKGRS